MNIAGDDENSLSFADELLASSGDVVRGSAKLSLNLLVVREMSKILGGGDRYRDERPALSRLSDLLISDPVGFCAELLEIGGQFLPVG